MKVTVYIGIGSNIGDRGGNCLRSIELMKEAEIDVTRVSGMHETRPWGEEEQPNFINMCIEVKTSLSPHELLARLKCIERSMGRTETYRWGPRLIDLDILYYGDEVIDTEDLKIPHPYIMDREFVRTPLTEIAPDIIKRRIKG